MGLVYGKPFERIDTLGSRVELLVCNERRVRF